MVRSNRLSKPVDVSKKTQSPSPRDRRWITVRGVRLLMALALYALALG